MPNQDDQIKLSNELETQGSPNTPPVSRIAVRRTEAAEMLHMSVRHFQRLLPDLRARGLKRHRTWYLVDSLRQAFEKLCDDYEGNVRRQDRRNQSR